MKQWQMLTANQREILIWTGLINLFFACSYQKSHFHLNPSSQIPSLKGLPIYFGIDHMDLWTTNTACVLTIKISGHAPFDTKMHLHFAGTCYGVVCLFCAFTAADSSSVLLTRFFASDPRTYKDFIGLDLIIETMITKFQSKPLINVGAQVDKSSFWFNLFSK